MEEAPSVANRYMKVKTNVVVLKMVEEGTSRRPASQAIAVVWQVEMAVEEPELSLSFRTLMVEGRHCCKLSSV